MHKLLSTCLVVFYVSHLSADAFSDAYRAYQNAYSQQRYAEAIPLLKTIIEHASNKFGDTHINTLNLQYSLANNLAMQKDYDASFEQYEAMEQDYIAAVGDTSVEYYEFSLQRLVVASNLIFSRNRTFERKQAARARQVLALAERLVEQEPEQEATLMYQFVRTLQDTRAGLIKLEKTIQVAERTFNSLQTQVGEDDLRTIGVQFYLGQLYEAKKRPEDAISTFESLVNIVDEATSFSHPYTLGAHARLVDLYESEGESEKATEHCIAIGRMTPWQNDIEPVPLYRKNPVYPVSALRRGVDGWAQLKFDITPYGFVENIEVIEYSGSNSFAAASKEALSGWRYAPKFVEGDAVTAEDMKVQLSFKLDR